MHSAQRARRSEEVTENTTIFCVFLREYWPVSSVLNAFKYPQKKMIRVTIDFLCCGV